MDENKRTAKGIKLNASQLPLSNKADFVIGADSRKVLDNKIIENLGNTGSHGYFPSNVGRGYKSWSVSRELEIPTLPEDAEAQMRMIEGASADVPLQNESASAASSQSDPFFMHGGEADSNPFAHEPKHAESPFESPDASYVQSGRNPYEVEQPLPEKAPSSTPASDPSLAAQLTETVRETVPKKLAPPPAPQTDADAPSPWSGPITDKQTPAVVRQNLPQSQSSQWTESPWAGPVMAKQPSVEASANQPAATTSGSDEGWVFVDSDATAAAAQPHLPIAEQEAPPVVEQQVPIAKLPAPSAEAELIPSWMSAMATDGTAGSDFAEVEDSLDAAITPVGEEVELETFLNSIPDEEFIIDNETMRHLFSSLCEPKSTSLKIKSPASDAADLAIAAAAAEILNTEVSIDEISIDDIATEEVMAVEVTADADFEAIQQAYAMLDLSPLPVSQRKEGSFDNVFDVVEKAAEEQSLSGAEGPAVHASADVSRTERGTIEMAIHAGGRQLVPQYNFCGMLTGVEMSDGLSFVLSEEKNTWQMIEQTGKVMVSGIKSVSFDKQGNLSYVTKRGDTVTLKVDGTIDTKFAKKILAEAPQQAVETEFAADRATVETSKMPAKPVEKTAPTPVAKTAPTPVEKTPPKPVAKTPKKPPVKEPANVKQAKSGAVKAKADPKSQSKETKPAAKSASKPKKKGR